MNLHSPQRKYRLAAKGRRLGLVAYLHHSYSTIGIRPFKIPEFFYYAIADGLRWLFVRHGKWRGWNCPREERGDLQMELELLTG